ncbi:MAG: hypothetical protein J6S87_01990 [Bacteroidales bacterium]|jgi:hypothetical protein|nr:hypothetical protein [Bacteroidales bacterium]
MKSSIIDVPRKYSEADLFGIQKYQNALVKFIRLTDTPITIALQGEWGSGKTSLMNQLRYELCDKDGAPYFPVWVNTWQYSLMKTPPQAIMSILEGCINQIGEINPDHKWNESKKKIGGIFKKMASVGAKVAASTVGVDGDVVDELFGGESAESDILQLKNEIAKLIEEALKMNPSKIGFTFYIDDLDRIDPPVAVEILELMKNIFDLDKCVFILAIDYDVVIKGLRSKFGELTDKNEREFRAFFDKIIQLPFSMPVASYNVDTFLVDALQKIEFFSPKELENESLAENLSEIARLSVGSNPRSLKRLSNTLSLISIINEGDDDDEGNDTNATQAKLINFALVCMQIAYPYVYNQLTEEPDFKNWNDGTAAKLKLRHLTEDEKESLNAATEFDEEWEKVLFRMCQKETYLSIRAFQVSRLLNKIAEIIGNDDKLGDIVESVIALSAVTNLKAFDTAPKRGKSQAALEIMSFFEHFVADLKPSIPSIRAVKGKTYGRIYERNNLKAEFRCSPKDNSFTLQIQTENPDMVEKINVMAGGDLAKYHFNYHLGKKNQNLHKWEAQLEGDYRTNTDQIKESCIEFYNAVVKL